ncbi:hypothetical protein [Halorhabdus sp. SVX81]|uniref:hypothetical protein n=1 Tax=Halorhabdus sp. SVX81 TaxID=2978283 RepID=UPI0023DADC2C|nr:hypothetical protein [Halorhabdus sp. SVX81]
MAGGTGSASATGTASGDTRQVEQPRDVTDGSMGTDRFRGLTGHGALGVDVERTGGES